MSDHVTPSGLTLRKMLPRKSYYEPPEYEVLEPDGTVVGWIEYKYLGRKGHNLFYEATAVHPVSGDRVKVGTAPGVEDRVLEIADFLSSPDDYFARNSKFRVRGRT